MEYYTATASERYALGQHSQPLIVPVSLMLLNLWSPMLTLSSPSPTETRLLPNHISKTA